MKYEMRMSYRKLRRLNLLTNTERCLVLRRLYAIKMLDYLERGYRVINIDESWLSTTDCRHMKWGERGKPNTLSMPECASRINIIAALDTEGRVYLSMT